MCFLGREPNARREAKKKCENVWVTSGFEVNMQCKGGVCAARLKPRMKRGVLVR